MAWKQAVSGFFKSTPMISMYGGICATALYVGYKDYIRKQRMIVTYKNGNLLSPYIENKFEVNYQRRPREEHQIRSLLNSDFTNEYYFVYGEVGVGKTRLFVEVIRKMIEENNSKKNGAPIFVSVGQGSSFPDTLAEAVNFNFDEHISFSFYLDIIWRIESIPKKDNQSKFTRVLDAIEETAFEYMVETGNPVVLVIDGINDLKKEMPGALEILQDKAKLWADANIVKMIFINNDENIEEDMQKNPSSWSRCGECFIIGDLTRNEAIEFLTASDLMENHICKGVDCLKFTMDEAEKIFDLVGGRILDLIAFKRQYTKGVSVDEISESLRNRVREKFIRVSHNPSTWKVISVIRCSPNKVMKLSQLIKLTSKEDVNILLKFDIIRYERSNVGTLVKFSSILTENVVNELEQIYIKEKEESSACGAV